MIQIFLILIVIMMIYTVVGYPFLLLVAATIRRAKGENNRVISKKEEACSHRVAHIIPCYNEEEIIEKKIANCSALHYPKKHIETIFVSDASTDTTDSILKEKCRRGFRYLHMPQRKGKNHAINCAVRATTGNIILLSDANSMLTNDSIWKLIRHFNDPRVGCVTGQLEYMTKGEKGQGEILYWTFETWLKGLESEVGSVIGCVGALLAIRKNLCPVFSNDTANDIHAALSTIKNGYRVVYESGALAREWYEHGIREDFERKTRVIQRGMASVVQMRDLLNFFRYGFVSIQLISHKVLRWTLPWMLLIAFILSILQLGTTVGKALFAVQCVFYLAAITGMLCVWCWAKWSVLYVPFYFVLTQIAAAKALYRLVIGDVIYKWE